MKRIEEFAEGLKILAKYDSDGFSVCAEHDVVYAGPGDADEVDPEDADRLQELGWHIDSDVHRWRKYMTKMKASGSYIHDFPPVLVVRTDLTADEVREIAREKLGIEDLEPMVNNDLIHNKVFVEIEPPDANGMALALYNHDGVYSVRRYKPRPKPV